MQNKNALYFKICKTKKQSTGSLSRDRMFVRGLLKLWGGFPPHSFSSPAQTACSVYFGENWSSYDETRSVSLWLIAIQQQQNMAFRIYMWTYHSEFACLNESFLEFSSTYLSLTMDGWLTGLQHEVFFFSSSLRRENIESLMAALDRLGIFSVFCLISWILPDAKYLKSGTKLTCDEFLLWSDH